MKNTRLVIKILSFAMLLSIALSIAAPTLLAADSDARSAGKLDFVLADDSHYTAIGSGYSVADKDLYATAIAKRYGLSGNFTMLDEEGLRISDIRALLDPSFKNGAYGQALFEGMDVDALRAEYVNAIKNSNLITVDLGVEDFTSFAANQIIALALKDYRVFITLANNAVKFFPKLPTATAYDLDWSQFKGDTSIEDIDNFLDSIDVRMTSTGMKIDDSMKLLEDALKEGGSKEVEIFKIEVPIEDVAGDINIPSTKLGDLQKNNATMYVKDGKLNVEIKVKLIEYVQYIVKTYIYAFASYAYNYAEVVERIRELNPDATIVILGKYNFFKNVELEIDGVAMDFNAYANDFVYMLNQVAERYANEDPNAIYVPCLDTETIFDATYSDRSIFNVVEVDRDNSEIRFNNDVLTPSKNGHAYMAQRVIDSLNVLCDHKYTSSCDTVCNKCSDVREGLAAHTYDNACDIDCNVCAEEREFAGHVYDGCTDADCNECGETRVAGEHQYGGACDIDCNVCGNPRTGAIEHTYDNSCDEYCNVCNEKNASAAHTYGEWVETKPSTTTEKGEKSRTCSVCGNVETAELELLTSEPDDEKSPVAAIIVCIVVGVGLVVGILLARKSRAKKPATEEKTEEKSEKAPKTEENAPDTEETEEKPVDDGETKENN